MWTLTYRRPIPPEDLLLRVMGHDRDGAYYWVTAVQDWDGTATRATLALLPPGETRIVARGPQDFIAESAVTFPGGGAPAQLTERA